MRFVKYVALLLCLGGGMMGCMPRMDGPWAEPRPLGREFKTYQAPEQPAPDSPASHTMTVAPAGELTLGEALAFALLRNPELAVFSWEVRQAEARMLQARLLPNPELEVEFENFGGDNAFENDAALESTVALSQLIELGGKRVKRARLAALERDLETWDYEAKRLDVLTATTKAFVEVLAAQERLVLHEELARLAEQVAGTISERVKAGKVSPVEETRAVVALSSARIERDRATRGLEASRKTLVAAWGGQVGEFTRAEGNLDEIRAIPSLEQVEQRISRNPELARWVDEMARRQAALDLEKAKRVSDVTLSGGIRRFEETDDNAFILGFSIPVPLFDRNQGAILEAEYGLAKANEEQRAAEMSVRGGLAEAYKRLSTAHAEALALKNDVLPGAESAFNGVEEGYRQGKFGYLEVLDAQRTLFNARGQYLEALAVYHAGVADVEEIIGEALNIDPPIHQTKESNDDE